MQVTGKLLLILFVSLGGFAAGCSVGTTGQKPEAVLADAVETRGTAVGQRAPEFQLSTVDGGTVSQAGLEGSPAVVVFWTAWCPTCKEEAPHINELNAKFESRGVRVVGVNIGESDARIAEGIKDFGIKYTVAKDADSSVAKNYNVVGTPTVVFLDKAGIVRYFGNELPKDSSARLEELLAN